MAHPAMMLAIWLGVGIATAAFMYFITESERPHRQIYAGNDTSRTRNTYEPSRPRRSSSSQRRRDTSPPLQCTICLDPLGNANAQLLNCSHRFHRDCVDKWLQTQRNCPICRTPQ